MYMFNRSQEQPVISQFIKGQILEEDSESELNQGKSDENSSSLKSPELDQKIANPVVKNKSDDDFMFQMDRGSRAKNINSERIQIKTKLINFILEPNSNSRQQNDSKLKPKGT